MTTCKKLLLGATLLLTIAATAVAMVARAQSHRLITNPFGTREMPEQTPAAAGLPFSEVTLTNKAGLRLVAWYVPSKNGAAIIAQHGYKKCRSEMIPAAAVLHRHGYGVLLCSVRAHDLSSGEQITFGVRELEDLQAWCQYLRTRTELDPERIGALGNSMGGSLVIQLAAHNPCLKAVAADSPFSSLQDTVSTSVTHYTGLPSFPFAPLIFFWAEVESGCRLSQINAKAWVHQLSPRPVFLMQGGADTTVPRQCGQLLYAAAAEPKELWYDPLAGHARFATNMPAYEQRLVAFFDKYLLATNCFTFPHPSPERP